MVTKHTLGSGITVLMEPIRGVVSASVGVWIKTGSRSENERQYGYAHFVEHMLFKGTATLSAQEIARIVDRVGGQHNAATNREYTCYYINIVSDHLELALRILSDMYYNSLFATEELGKEKNVIIEEIRMYEDTPDEFIHDLFMESMLSGHPLSHSILGSIESIQGTTRERMLDFYDRHYHNENLLITIAGNFEEERVRDLLEKYFSGKRTSPAAAAGQDPSMPQRIFDRHVERDLEQVHFCLGSEGIKSNDDDRWALYALSTILGGSMSSRLFQNIREKEGISYSIYSFHSSYSDCGVYGIYCATSPENYGRALDLIVKECHDIIDPGITGEELQDAKTFMIGNLALSLESVEVRMSQLAKNEILYGRHFEFNDMVEQIESITADDFRRIAGRIFRNKRLSLVSVGVDGAPGKRDLQL
ncbi:MAG: insulinase family protein [Spirochaetes bacterium]|nr:insulinase family protein [Spirochaetota bacterium]